MRVRAVQFSPGLADLDGNIKVHRDEINRAVSDGVDMIVFPELSLTGYHLKDAVSDVAMAIDHPYLQELKQLSKEIDLVVGSVIEDPPGIYHNAAIYFHDQRMIHMHRKTQLPNFGMFQEAMIFKPGDGFASFRVRGQRIGLLICREILFPINAYLYFLQHVDLLIGISNSPFRGLNSDNFSSLKLWESMGYVFSVFYQLNYLFVNRTGFEDGMGFGGGSFYARAGAGIEKQCAYFSDEIMDATVKIEDVRKARASANYLRDDRALQVLSQLKRIVDD